VSVISRRLRVLVVDDSPAQRQVLIRLLEQDPHLEIVGWSANGAEALRAVALLSPDVITLDDRMPIMDGLDAARTIMRDMPTPIVMVSTATGADARELEDAALAAGVLAVQDKQALSKGPGCGAELVRLIRSMASVRLVRRRREPVAELINDADTLPGFALPTTPEIVAIGASTGGPQALRAIISRLPACFPLPVLVVQHTTAGYSNTLVDWLRVGTRLHVRVAEDGEPLEPGRVYIAPTERHLVVQGRHVSLLDDAPVSLHRPSATVLFRSVAHAFGARSIGVLLTGMGDDGAIGLSEMKAAGAVTIAQDEASSVVFGMPAEAIRLGAANSVLPLQRIPAALLDQVAGRSSPP
jgi:two-component system, chemotaxis family, protein-glutamate methylesterase/glutaminase